MPEPAPFLTPPTLVPVEGLHRSHRTIVMRCRWRSDNRLVIVKMPVEEVPGPELLTRYRREFALLQELEHPGVVRAYELLEHHGVPLLVLEDIGGRSLQTWLQEYSFSPEEVLSLLLATADALGYMHDNQMIHRDINPSNLIWCKDTGHLQIIDLSISSALNRKSLENKQTSTLEGTLAYMSPEQTGRMNRAIDYRTDFYSLGATVWHLLVGEPPFPVEDSLELIHAHLARQPTPPHQHRADVPPVLSNIIRKLMAKHAEERYQSAAGLVADVKRCLHNLAHGEASHFALGSEDQTLLFTIPNRLYGRDEEKRLLANALLQVRAGDSCCVLVGGSAGIGKTSLVQELHQPLMEAHGYFAAGRFDQLLKDIPYQAWLAALRSLLQQILTEDSERLREWRAVLTEAIGLHAGLLVALLPELQYLLEHEHSTPSLEPQEARNHLHMMFLRLLKGLLEPKRPLVMFLDDLQWADGASLELLEYLLTAPDLHGFLLVVGYRNDEVDSTHTLSRIAMWSSERALPIQHLQPEPLQASDIEQMLMDICRCTPAEAHPLATLLQTKTAGNPFFLRALLQRLHEDGLIWAEGFRWVWDLEQIRDTAVTDNVVALMMENLQRLPSPTCQLLQMAACLGREFTLEMLVEVLTRPIDDIIHALQPVLKAGLVIPQGEHERSTELSPHSHAVFRFAHDRVEEAAYALLAEEERGAIHRKIGRLLLSHHKQSEMSEELFTIVGHLGRSLAHMETQEERIHFARLALAAGKRAHATAAFENAFVFFESGLSALGEQRWEQTYELTLALSNASLEAGFLSRNNEGMKRRIDEVLNHTRTLVEQIPAWTTLLRAHIAEQHIAEALQVSDQFLALAKEPQPRSCHLLAFLWDLLRTRIAIGRRSPEDLLELPEAQGPLARGIQEVYFYSSIADAIMRPDWVPVHILRDVRTVLRDGVTALGALCWTGYALILCFAFNKVKLGTRFGNLALAQVEKLDRPDAWPRIAQIVYGGILSWSMSMADLLPRFREVHLRGMEVGDLTSAIFGVHVENTLAYCTGMELARLRKQLEWADSLRKRHQIELGLAYSYVFQALNILQQQNAPTSPIQITRLGDEREFPLIELYHATLELHLNLVYGGWQAAFALACREQKSLQHPLSTLIRGPYWTYTLVALYRGWELQWDSRRLIQKRIRRGLQQLRRWVKHLPESREYRLTWLQAAKHRCKGRYYQALERYDIAYDQAQQAGFRQDAALIAEHTAELCERMGRRRMARVYRQEALAIYRQWGALTKVAQLEAEYPELFLSPGSNEAFSTPHTSSNDPLLSQGGARLDLETVLRASRVLSGESETEALLRQLMRLALENAGAEQGWLLIKQQEQWSIAAEAHVDGKTIHLPNQPIDFNDEQTPLPTAMLRYVALTQEPIVLFDAARAGPFIKTPYIVEKKVRSVLCSPLLSQRTLLGILYLENNLAAGVFTPERRELLDIIAGQAAVLFEKFRLRSSQENPLPQSRLRQKTLLAYQETEDAFSLSASPRRAEADTLHGDVRVRTVKHLQNEARVGQVVGTWELIRLLGEGGMSVVYEAEHITTGQRVAIKLLLPQFSSKPQHLMRFRREALTMGRLQHPNIIAIHDFASDPYAGDFMVLELLEGENLHDIIERHAPLSLTWLLEITEQLCQALQASHQAGILHRDLKPSNIFLLPGGLYPRVKLLDFGIAKLLLDEKTTRLTSTGAIIGTPAYLAPEQLKSSSELTPATDIYALGVILYQALTKTLPLGDESGVEQLLRILQAPPIPLGERRPEFRGSPLEELFEHVFCKSPHERPSSIAIFWDELEMACQQTEDPNDAPKGYPAIVSASTGTGQIAGIPPTRSAV